MLRNLRQPGACSRSGMGFGVGNVRGERIATDACHPLVRLRDRFIDCNSPIGKAGLGLLLELIEGGAVDVGGDDDDGGAAVGEHRGVVFFPVGVLLAGGDTVDVAEG